MGEVSSLGKPPGWSHRLQMKQYMRALAPKVKATGAFDRDLHKEVARLNAASRIEPESVVQQIIHDPLPTFETKSMDSNRSGLKDALAALKDRAATSRQRALDAGERIEAAFKRHADATESLNRHADEMTREADDVLAELGQFSNGGPS